VSEGIGWKLIEELQRDPKLRKALAETLTYEIPEILLKDKRVRLTIVRSLIREVATKEDIEKTREHVERVRQELRQEIARVRQELAQKIEALEKEFRSKFEDLSNRVARLEGQVALLIKVFIAFNVPILIGIIGILLKMILAP